MLQRILYEFPYPIYYCMKDPGRMKKSCGIDWILSTDEGLEIFNYVYNKSLKRKWVSHKTIAYDFIDEHPSILNTFNKRMVQTLVSRALRHHGFVQDTGTVYIKLKRKRGRETNVDKSKV